jgi:hypothetical protein
MLRKVQESAENLCIRSRKRIVAHLEACNVTRHGYSSVRKMVVVVVVVCEIKHIWAGERSRRSFIAGPGEERIIASGAI